MADPMIFVPAPARRPRRGGIKAVTGDFTTLERMGAAENVHYVSEGCSFPSLLPGLCWGAAGVPGDKVAEGLDTITGIVPIFGQYTGVECFLGVGTTEEYRNRAETLLRATEEHEIEAAVVGWAAGGAAAGTGAGIVAAIAAAEEWADQRYNALPVIWISRRNAVLAGAGPAVFGDGLGVLWTVNGTPVVATWTMPDDRVYVTGWPTVYASNVQSTVVRNLSVNQEMAIAERLYGIAIDCEFRASVTVTAVVADPQEPDPDEPLEILLGSIPSSPIPDGTDATIIAQTNVTPTAEVFLWYSVNGDPAVLAGEMTQTNPHEFVWNVVGDSTTTGDSVELWAVSEFEGADVESNHITIEVT